MKKFLSLFAAVLFAGSMMAETVTINAADITGIEDGATTGLAVTIQGISLSWSGAYYNNEQSTDVRVYANGTLTLSAANNISKVEIVGYAKKELAVTVNKGSVTTGASYSSETTKEDWNDPLIVVENINAKSVTLTCSKQMRAYSIRVTTDGEGGEGGETGEGGEGGEEEGTYAYDENTDFEVNFATYTVDDEYLAEYGSIYVEAKDNNNNYIILDITLPENAESLVAGTYNVVVVENDEYPYQSVTAGFYYDDEDDGGIYPSYAAVTSGEDLEKIWYIVSGTVIVDENLAITVNAKNSLGKSVKAVLAAKGEGGEGGEGGEEIGDVITCAKAAELALAGNTSEVTIEGYVTGIVEEWSSYKNVSFWMADEKDGGQVFQAFRVNCETAADAPAVGDKVRVTGKLTKYTKNNVTIAETEKGGSFEIIEKGEGGNVTPEPSVVTCAKAAELALSGSTDKVIIEGYVTEYVEEWSNYKNISFWMADTKDGGQVFEAFRVNCETADEAPAVGDKVRVTGKLTSYTKDNVTIAETQKGGSFEIIETTAVDNITVDGKAVKVIENGSLIILKNGTRFNVIGQIVR